MVSKVVVKDELQDFILESLKNIVEAGLPGDSLIFQEWGYPKTIRWAIQLELQDSILLWHIATDLLLCGHGTTTQEDQDAIPLSVATPRSVIMFISEYLIYLLVLHPSMILLAEE